MSKEEQKNIPDTRDFLSQLFKDADKGARHVVDCFPSLYQKSLAEVKGAFGLGELYLIIDAFTGLSIAGRTAGEYLINECTRVIDEDSLDLKWGVNRDEFIQKATSLTVFQAFALEIWACAYWRGGGAKLVQETADRDLEKHVALLLE